MDRKEKKVKSVIKDISPMLVETKWDDGTSAQICYYDLDKKYIKSEENFDSGGIKEGVDITYYTSGKKKQQLNYVKGKKNGKSFYWNPGGILIYEVIFEDDINNGKYLTWHHNGIPSYETTYKNGIPEGMCTTWYDNGKIEKKFERKDDKYYGKYKEFYKDGQIHAECEYDDNGQKTGMCRCWFPDRTLSEEAEHKDGKLEGKWYLRNDDGLSSLGYFRLGKLHGTSQRFYKNNNKKFEWQYDNGTKEGLCEEWYDDNRLKLRCSYKNGLLHGEFCKYDLYGNKAYECIYEHGKILKVTSIILDGKDYKLPDFGDITVWKACLSVLDQKENKFVIVKILVPSLAKRVVTQSMEYRFKSRIEFGTVLEIKDDDGTSYSRARSFVSNNRLEYIVGKEVHADEFDERPEEHCGHGIHVQKYKEDCEQWREYFPLQSL